MLSCLELLACAQYHIASFLATNNFNTVRLPVMVDHILKNTKPNKAMINTFTNQALVVKDYLSLPRASSKCSSSAAVKPLDKLSRLRKFPCFPSWSSSVHLVKCVFNRVRKVLCALTLNLCGRLDYVV